MGTWREVQQQDPNLLEEVPEDSRGVDSARRCQASPDEVPENTKDSELLELSASRIPFTCPQMSYLPWLR